MMIDRHLVSFLAVAALAVGGTFGNQAFAADAPAHASAPNPQVRVTTSMGQFVTRSLFRERYILSFIDSDVGLQTVTLFC